MQNTQYSVLALLISFTLSLVIGYFLIPKLKRLKFGQQVREDGPKSHLLKNGIPTMGGLIFIASTLITVLMFALVINHTFSYYLGIVLVVFIGYAIIGFVDDYLNIKSKREQKGLKAIEKLVLQFVVAAIAYYLYTKLNIEKPNAIVINTLNIEIYLGKFYFIYILLMIVGFSNAVNITDGLDGLSSGLSIISFVIFGLIAWRMSLILPQVTDVAIFSFILVGSLLGFLFYNVNPAKVFMGDTGSLSLGATLAIIAILTSHDITLFFVGGVFVIETISVVMQVTSYKLTKKRVFLMAPLHHHFELLGWSEQQIVRMFWIFGFIFGLLGLWFGVLS